MMIMSYKRKKKKRRNKMNLPNQKGHSISFLEFLRFSKSYNHLLFIMSSTITFLISTI